MKVFLLGLALGVAMPGVAPAGASADRPSSAKATEGKPNIVFIFIDDMGYADPSCFGNPHVETPHIDRLADEGIRLTNFYVNSPICSPSRVAVTTGVRWIGSDKEKCFRSEI